VRCPVLVGRRRELTALRSALAAARIGRGAAVALTGPPGIGKSRLLREATAAADAWDVPVLRGRGVPSATSSAFRPLTEALLGALRHGPLPDDPTLTPFMPVLGRILPQWRRAGPRPDDSPVVLGEGVLRLLTALAGRGVLLVVEDLHWADPDTLGVLEYLADNVAAEPVLMLFTARDEPGPAIELLRRLAGREACTVLALPPLTGPEVDAMAAACCGGDPPDATRAALRHRAGGTPLLVEELLVAGIDPAVAVPATVAELVTGRLADLAGSARRCVEVAAVLGRRFDWRLLPGVLERPAPDVLADLRAGAKARLVEPDGADEFRFHHALDRDAVLTAMLPPERAHWAGRALEVVVAAHPGLDGPWCDLAADLAVRAGDAVRAGELLHEAGRRNLEGGALASAEAVLRRALALAPPDSALGAGIDEALADVLAQSGRTGEAVEAAERVLERARPGGARAAAQLRLARVHATAGLWAEAWADLDAARAALGDPSSDESLALRVEAVATQVALGAGRLADAAAAAGEVVARAERCGAPDALCEALLVLGRLARRDDLPTAETMFTRARRVAEDAGLTLAAARAAAELGIADAQASLRFDRLADARDRATAAGDLGTVAVLDLQAAASHITRWELDEGVAAAARCAATSRRLRLPTLPKALVLGVAAESLRGGRADAERVLAEAVGLAPQDTHLLGEVAGTRAFRALAAADDVRALRHLDDAMAAFRRRSNEVTGSPAIGLWILLHTVTDTHCTTAPPPPEPFADRWSDGLSRFAEAVATGRRGDAATACRQFAAADTRLREPVDIGWFRLQARRLVAGAALADRWGDPVAWIREDLPVLEARGEERWAAALRGLLRQSGQPIPRRGQVDRLPEPLRRRGVTAREADVLALVAEGRANREIAERLYLSTRTVEKHVERLLAKLALTRRAELAAWTARELRGP
jgi:DNA-binding CsgD family transcriptional regulator